MRSTLLTVCLLAGLVAACPLLASDTLELSNGTKLVGTLTKEENGKIYFHVDLVGDVVVESDTVVKRVIAEPASVAAAPPATEGQAPMAVTSAPPPPAATSTVPPSPTEAAAAAPAKAFWKRIISVNGSYTSAAYNQGPIKGAPAGFPTGAQAGLQGRQSTLNMSGTLIGATPYQSFSLTGSYGYANYQPAGTVLNNHAIDGTYTYVLSPKDYLLTRGDYKVDKPAGVDYSYEQVFGFGHKLIDTDRTHLDLIPGVSFLKEERGTIWDHKWIFSGGFLEHLDYAFNDKVSLEQRFKYRVGFEHTQIWAIDSYLGIKAAITEHISFTTGATYTYDNTLGPVPPALVTAFLAQGLPLSLIRQLEPANKGELLISSGLEYNW